MRTLLSILWRVIRALPILLLAPVLSGLAMLALAVSDVLTVLRRPKPLPASQPPARQSASVVIPNWNGRDLLKSYLPSVVAALRTNPDNEILVVDNGSTDGSADFLRDHFPSVRVLALDRNLGFGGGSNAGFAAARNDVVVLLNSDMRVDLGFLAPLLAGFDDDRVFAVSCQIFFTDPNKLREETGLTEGWWDSGSLRVRHRIDDAIKEAYPCFYGGGGSCAFDRHKFLELGGFDSLLEPFYLEDTDLGYLAWKRGWKVLYEPRSVVYHEHRGTIGKRFDQHYIARVLKKNFILFAWKNIHEWRRLWDHFFYLAAGAALSALFGDSPERPNFAGLWAAFTSLPRALRSRRRAHGLAVVSDTEAFRRPMGAYFRDRFANLPAGPPRLAVLFLSPYPMLPPVHGGAVFMSQTVRRLAALVDLHLIILIDHEWEREPHAEFERLCASVEYVTRMEGTRRELGSIVPHAVTEYANADLAWLIHRQICIRRIDVLQIEYTAMAQYGMEFQRLGCVLFEHDIYFQSIARQLKDTRGPLRKIVWRFEYLRAFRYELNQLGTFDRVQVCSPANAAYVRGFLPAIASRLDDDLRAGIDTGAYTFHNGAREPRTMLFLGSFRHPPNEVALQWFVTHILPRILERAPDSRLIVVGSDPPPRHSLPDLGPSLELRGYVDDVREPLGRYAVFVCPILSGSGMRVKLLEAFASGIPVVSTTVGAEGLAERDGEYCALADEPDAFAQRVLSLFEDEACARAMAESARDYVVRTKDMAVLTERLAERYRELVIGKRRRREARPAV